MKVNLYPTGGQSAQDHGACLLCGSFKYMTSIRSTSGRPRHFLALFDAKKIQNKSIYLKYKYFVICIDQKC